MVKHEYYGHESHNLPFSYVARVRVRVRDSAIFEKGGCGCGGTRQLKKLKNIFIYIFNILLSILFHIIQTYQRLKTKILTKQLIY